MNERYGEKDLDSTLTDGVSLNLNLSDSRAAAVMRAMWHYRNQVAAHDSYDFRAPYINCKLAPGFDLPKTKVERKKCVISAHMFDKPDEWEKDSNEQPE